MESTCCHECDVARVVAVSKLHRDSCSSSSDRRFAAGGCGGGWRRPCGSGRSGRPATRKSSPHDSCELIARQSVVHCRPPLHDLRGHFPAIRTVIGFRLLQLLPCLHFPSQPRCSNAGPLPHQNMAVWCGCSPTACWRRTPFAPPSEQCCCSALACQRRKFYCTIQMVRVA
jgi:hypothetical protein